MALTPVSLLPNANLGAATTANGSEVILDGLEVQDCRLFFPKLPDVLMFLQSVSLPVVSVNEVTHKTRYVDQNEIGEKLNYEPYTLTFMVDKKFRNWSSIFNWMKRMTVSGSKVDDQDNPVLIIDGKHAVRFIGAWPMALGNIEWDTTVGDVRYMVATLKISYDYLDLLVYQTEDSVYT